MRGGWGEGRKNACEINFKKLVESLHKEQKKCIENLFLRRDVFALLPTGFGKSLIFQLFPRLTSQRNAVNSTIIVVTPLVMMMKDQVEQL